MTEHPTTPAAEAEALAATYVAAWQARDWARLRSVLADDVTFRGPLGAADGADDCVTGLQRMAAILDRIDVQARASSTSGAGEDAVTDVITWFDLHSTVAPPAPTANWSRVRAGKIVAIRAAFDPRALLEGLARQG